MTKIYRKISKLNTHEIRECTHGRRLSKNFPLYCMCFFVYEGENDN